MKYTLTCEWPGGRGEFPLDDDGIYYVAYGDEGVHIFSKPTRGKHFTLIIDRGTLHVVHEGIARPLAVGEPSTIGEVGVIINAASAVPVHLAGYVRAAHDRIRAHAKPIGIAVAALVVAGVVVYAVAGRHEDRAQHAVVARSGQSVVDDIEKARVLIEMRYKLAEKALAEGHAEKALRVLDQIIKSNPKDARAVALRDDAVRQAERERLRTREGIARDAWIQRTMDEATRRMADGDHDGARFVVLQVLEIDPDNARAKELHDRVSAEINTMQQRKSLEDEQQILSAAEARRLFDEGRTLMERDSWAEAYRALKRSADILAEHGLRPDFELDLRERLGEARHVIERRVQELLARAEESYARGMTQSAVASKTSHLRQAMQHLEDARAMSGLDEGAALKKSILAAFDAALEPMYVEAVTLQELEGCCFAHARFKQIKQLAKFSEVHHYKASESAMNRCPCER